MNHTLDRETPCGRLGTIVVPAYNEGAIIERSLGLVADTLRRSPMGRAWEILVVDDGSADETAQAAGRAAQAVSGAGIQVRLLRHVTNRGLGGALQTGLGASRGDVVVVMDCDLSYDPEHIQRLVEALEAEHAQIAVASPYMPGGRTIGVPPHIERRSRLANSFLSWISDSPIHTFTGMVRAYDGRFARALALRSMGDEINVEALYKAEVLRGRIVEVPATLDWTGLAVRTGRSTLRNKRTRSKAYEMVISGLLFRPHLAFAAAGLGLVLLGGTIGLAALILPDSQVGLTILGVSAMVTGVFTVLVSLLSIQVKRSFDELYHLQSEARARNADVVEDEVGTGSASVRPQREAAPVEIVPRRPETGAVGRAVFTTAVDPLFSTADERKRPW